MKKYISILVFAIFFLFIGINNVFAHGYDISTIEFVVDDYCIVEMSDGNIYLLTPKESDRNKIAYFESTYNTIFSCKDTYSNYDLGTLKRYKLVGNEFVYYDDYYHHCSNGILQINQVIFSTCDINYVNHPEDTFFLAPPRLGVVRQKVEGLEMNKVLQEILGILPVILSVLVSLLALKKALRMLSDFLRKS